jgi:putative transcriptional regulator
MTVLEVIRRNNGISQTELGRQIGINPTSIAQIERGHRKSWPKLRKQLSETLGIDENLLFDEQGWPKKIDLNYTA